MRCSTNRNTDPSNSIMKLNIRALGLVVVCAAVVGRDVIAPRVARTVSNEMLYIETFQTQGNEKPAEDTFKNIKVLRGLPSSQMFSVMNFMRSSLGVSCAYCHVHSGGDRWQFESDEKQTKLMARRMIQMILENNRTNRELFVNARLTCFTCHRGNIRPVSLPSLPVPAPEGGAAGLPAAAKVSLPTAAEIIDRFVRAVGGRAAIEKIKSREMRGNLITWSGSELPLLMRLQPPEKIKITTGTGDQQRIQALNGDSGWVRAGNQTRPLAAGEVSRLRAIQNALALLSLTTATADMKVISKESIDGHETFVVERPAGAGGTERLYFDAKTGFLVRVINIVNTILAPIPEQIDFSDYKDVDGGKLPFSIRSSFVDPWIGVGRKFAQVKSVQPDDAAFAAPK